MTDKKANSETETILMALDQISQTIAVMTSVVGRLRTYLQEQDSARGEALNTENQTVTTSDNRTVH